MNNKYIVKKLNNIASIAEAIRFSDTLEEYLEGVDILGLLVNELIKDIENS